MQAGIYLITCVASGRVYVGQTDNITRRFNQHRALLRGNRHFNDFLQAAWNAHGEDAFCFELVEQVPAEVLDQKETDWFNTFPRTRLFNVNEPGRGGRRGHTLSDATKRRISEANRGRILSDVTRRKMSAARIGNTFSKGVTFDDARRAQHSASIKAWWAQRHPGPRTRNPFPKPRQHPHDAKTRQVLCTVIFPSGERRHIVGLQAFCKEHGLNQGNMSSVISGRLKHTKGFKCLPGHV